MDVQSRRELLDAGWTPARITRATAVGELIRLRRSLYATPRVPDDVAGAVRAGGRLTCVSELRLRGVWVPETTAVHVHVAAHSGRARRDGGTVLHWSALVDPEAASVSRVALVDALAAAADCLAPWWAIAAMDSAVNRGDLSLATLRRALGGRSARVGELVRQVRADADSGLETIVRLLAVALGFRVTTHVSFPGIGVADILVEGWVVVETDGSAYHDVPTVAARDRRRDARHAAAGRTALRFRYSQVVHDLPSVASAIIGAVRTHRRVHNGGDLARRAERRLRTLELPPV